MWEIGHPLGIRGLAYVTFGVKDLDAAAQTYIERIGAIPVAGGVDDGGQFRYQLVQLGDSLLQLAADPEDCFGAPYFFTTDAVPEVP